MSRRAGSSAKVQRDQIRGQASALGCGMERIAAEMARQFGRRPRAAWRYALGWPQWKLMQEYNRLHGVGSVSANRVSAHETWPYGGEPPSLRYLANLAATYGHGCTPARLVDLDDLEEFDPAVRRRLLDARTARTGARPVGLADYQV